MNTSSSVKVRKIPHWKKGAPLKSFAFRLTAEQRKDLHMSSMKMGGFSHKYRRDVETDTMQVFGKNEKKILEDIKEIFPNVQVTVKRVFIPYGAK